MEDEAKLLHRKMKKDASKFIRTVDVYRGLDQEIKDFLNTCPLVQALTHKSMRPRHWEMLMSATGVEFTPPHKNPDMELDVRGLSVGIGLVASVASVALVPPHTHTTLPSPRDVHHMTPPHRLTASPTCLDAPPPRALPVVQALLELQLHTFTADVEEITDQALKEEKMEVCVCRRLSRRLNHRVATTA